MRDLSTRLLVSQKSIEADASVLPDIRPSLLLDFAKVKRLDPRITFARADATTCATYFDAFGVLRTAAANVPRFDHDPVTGACLGLLIEESRTNLLLNSTIDGANLATQSITTTAAARTLSFYGTGTVVLSGTHAATVVGSGAYPTRTKYTYTPTAGTLTLTVSGTVQYAQDERGASATSWMPTSGSPATRAIDLPTMTGANFTSWFNPSVGTIKAKFYAPTDSTRYVWSISDGSSNNYIYSRALATGADASYSKSGGAVIYKSAVTSNRGPIVPITTVIAYELNNGHVAIDGALVGSVDTAVDIAAAGVINQIDFGNLNSSAPLNGHISRLAYYPYRLSDAVLQGMTS